VRRYRVCAGLGHTKQTGHHTTHGLRAGWLWPS
jgi:hypothetical protein